MNIHGPTMNVHDMSWMVSLHTMACRGDHHGSTMDAPVAYRGHVMGAYGHAMDAPMAAIGAPVAGHGGMAITMVAPWTRL